MSLQGKVAVVTGGNRGLGLAMADAFGRAGASLAIWGRDEARNGKALATLRSSGHRAVAVRCDVADELAVSQAMEQSVSALGRLDVFVANAGVATSTSILTLDTAALRQMLEVNVVAAAVGFREAARVMVGQGGGGALIGIASTAGLHGPSTLHGYSASKAALIALVRCTARELGPYQIRCNALAPGWIETEMTAGDPTTRRAAISRTAVGRGGTTGDVVAAALLLADPEQSFHTGDTLVVDGGMLL